MRTCAPLFKKKLGLSHEMPLTKDNIKQLTHLEAQNREIRSIQGLEFAENLEVGLNLGGNLIQDITPLRSLTKLRGLVLLGNQVSDLSPLEPLTLPFIFECSPQTYKRPQSAVKPHPFRRFRFGSLSNLGCNSPCWIEKHKNTNPWQ